VISGLFMKAAVFPFHAWAPDAYASARLQVTAMLASVLKAAVVLALVRILGPVVLDAAHRRHGRRAGHRVHLLRQHRRAVADRASSGCWPTRRSPTPAT
jgi:hypothetical protein